MVRFTCTLIVLAAWIAWLPVAAMSQTPLAASGQPVTELAGSTEPDPLPGLPRPPDQPASLFQPPSAGPVYGCPELERPYFERDPRLDPAELPQPGWLLDVELGILGSSVVERLGQTSPPGQILVATAGTGHTGDVVSVPMAALNWTVSPRFELGYRLPSGFGELDVAYRFLLAEGTGSTTDPIAAPDATAALKSHLNIHVGDLDYASRETSLGPCWGMKWRIGLRTADVFFDSRADEPLAAVPGGGVFERSISNNFWGIGPHATLELNRRQNPWGFGWVGRLDSALLFGETQQRFAEVSTTSAADGSPLSGVNDVSNPQQVPMISGLLGLDWKPACRPNLDLLLGC
jgi:hypothetical protein